MSFFEVVQHESRSVEWWRQQNLTGQLELNPVYQRRADIWSRYKQAHLIDSIINGYDLPKFYVADFTLARSSLNAASKPYAVVDGKQRFGAIFAFLSNELALNKSTVYEADRSLVVRGLKFEELRACAPHLAARVQDFRPIVMSIVSDDQRKIDEMFVRLNSGVAANSAERRNAKPGPIPVLARELVDHAFFRDRIRFSTKRMADYQLAMKLLLLEHFGRIGDTKASNLDMFVIRAYEETVPAVEGDEQSDEQRRIEQSYVATKDRVTEVLESLSAEFRSNDSALAASSKVPVYYWLMRNHSEVAGNFRDFVVDFEARVLDALRASRDGAVVDQQLLNYYTLNRTSNDQSSLQGRYQILETALRRQRLID